MLPPKWGESKIFPPRSMCIATWLMFRQIGYGLVNSHWSSASGRFIKTLKGSWNTVYYLIFMKICDFIVTSLKVFSHKISIEFLRMFMKVLCTQNCAETMVIVTYLEFIFPVQYLFKFLKYWRSYRVSPSLRRKCPFLSFTSNKLLLLLLLMLTIFRLKIYGSHCQNRITFVFTFH